MGAGPSRAVRTQLAGCAAPSTRRHHESARVHPLRTGDSQAAARAPKLAAPAPETASPCGVAGRAPSVRASLVGRSGDEGLPCDVHRPCKPVTRGDAPSARPADGRPCPRRRTPAGPRPTGVPVADRALRSGATRPTAWRGPSFGPDGCVAPSGAGRPHPAPGSWAACAPAPAAPSRTTRPALAARRQTLRHRVRRHRRVTPSDRARRQPRLPVRQANHPAITPLLGQELKHVGRQHLDRFLVDHREERLQVEGRRPQCRRPGATCDELQVPVEERMLQRVPALPRRRGRADETGVAGHRRTVPAPSEIQADGRWITRVLAPVFR